MEATQQLGHGTDVINTNSACFKVPYVSCGEMSLEVCQKSNLLFPLYKKNKACMIIALRLQKEKNKIYLISWPIIPIKNRYHNKMHDDENDVLSLLSFPHQGFK